MGISTGARESDWARVRTAIVGAALIAISTIANSGVVEIPGEHLDESSVLWAEGVSIPRRIDLDAPLSPRIELPELSSEEVDQLIASTPDKSFRIGIHRDLPSQGKAAVDGTAIEWQPARGGGQVTTIVLISREAASLRMAIAFERVPAGSQVRFYSPADPSTALGPFEVPILVPDSTGEIFWSPVVGGEQVAIEIWVPSMTAADSLRFRLVKLSHLVRDPSASKNLRDLGDSGSCNKDLACESKWLDIGTSVAKYVVETGGFSIICTGQLVADTDPATQRYLFLTAAHCVSTKKEAKSMTFFWHFQRKKCKGKDPESVQQTGGGAKLRFTTGQSWPGTPVADQSLVELRRKPANAATLSGWTTAPAKQIQRKTVRSIHHPSGDVKMASTGKTKRLFQMEYWVITAAYFRQRPFTHLEVKWKKGTTEMGSSGGGIWIGKRWPDQHLVGTLSGGGASCQSRNAPDFYGMFVKTWNSYRKFRKQLDPLGIVTEP